MKRLTPMLLALGSLSVTAGAQSPFYEINGDQAADQFGLAVSFIADLDADGFDDLIIGAPDYSGDNGRVHVLSGATQQLIFDLTGPPGSRLGFAVADIGDIDADAIHDIAVGAPAINGGRVYLLSGADGTQIDLLMAENVGDSFGRSLAPAGDVDGDSVPDLIVGASMADGLGSSRGRVYVVSGVDRSEIWRFDGNGDGDRMGHSVSGGHDVDGDGVPDILVGAEGASYGATSGGLARLFSGADGSIIYTFISSRQLYRMGHAVALTGDLDADGRSELALAVPGEDFLPENEAGAVYIVSGRTGAVLTTLARSDPTSAERFGDGLAAGRDIDGDGVPDIVVTSERTWTTDRSWIAAFSGADFGRLWEFDWPAVRAVNVSGDLNGNGAGDVLIGLPVTSGAVVFGHCLGARQAHGDGLAGTGGVVPAVGASGCLSPGFDTRIQVSQGRGAAAGAVLIGFTGPASIPAFGGTIHVAPPYVAIPVVLDGLEGLAGAGSATLEFPLPFDMRLVGLQLDAQGLFLDLASPFGVSMTNGLEVVVR